MPQRSPEEIRRSIEANRAELAVSLERLRGEVAEVTDWRKQIREHQQQVLIGAALVERGRELFESEPTIVSEIGPVLAVHTGPGLLGTGGLPQRFVRS